MVLAGPESGSVEIRGESYPGRVLGTELGWDSWPSRLARALWLRALGLNTGSGHEGVHEARTFYLNFIEIVLIVCCCEVAICVLMTREHAEVNCIDCGSNRI